MSDKVIATAENGVQVTQSMIDEWSAAYEAGRLPAGYEFDGAPVSGRPPLFEGGMESITVRIPTAQKKALQVEAMKSGMNLSGYVRHVLALRTV